MHSGHLLLLPRPQWGVGTASGMGGIPIRGCLDVSMQKSRITVSENVVASSSRNKTVDDELTGTSTVHCTEKLKQVGVQQECQLIPLVVCTDLTHARKQLEKARKLCVAKGAQLMTKSKCNLYTHVSQSQICGV